MKYATLALAIVGIFVACAASFRHAVPAFAAPTAVAAVPFCAAFDPTLTQRNIEFLSARVKRDPESALDLNGLSSAYLQRCRETGDIADAVRAEQAARRSVAVRSRRNAAGYNALARSLLTQHRFKEALAMAKRADAIEPYSPSAGYLQAEIDIELGDYDEAKRGLTKARETLKNAQGLALWARIEELTGHPERALELLGKASDMVDHDVDALAQTVAWFHMRQGNVLAETGHADEAMAQYVRAVDAYPTDYRTLTCAARLCAGRGRWQDGLAWSTRSATVLPTPEVLGIERDCLHALGRDREAANIDSMVDVVGKLEAAQGAAFDRMRALYDADHDRNTAAAVRLARGELRERHDVYAYDTVAWCLFKNGQSREASRFITKALATGSRDSLLAYHAGMIAAASGDRVAAKSHLAASLSNTPCFAPFGPQRARAALARLSAEDSAAGRAGHMQVGIAKAE